MKSRINKLKFNMKWIILFIAIFSFIVIVRFLLKNELNLFDDMVYDVIKRYINPTTTKYVKMITKLGNVFTIVLACIIAVLCQRKYGFLLMINAGLTTLINVILKNIFIRKRPSIMPLIIENSYSFPSGHSMISVSFYGYLFYLAYKKIKNQVIRFITCLVLLITIILIGLSRIYLGVHYASDVLAGYLVSIVFLIIFIHVTSRYVEY